MTSSEYCMPVLGIIFLRHAANRYETALKQIQSDQASGKMPKRKLVKADFIKRRALMLPEEARYGHLLGLAGNQQLGEKLVEAMNAIEPDHGVVADLACGSAGMFVQSSHFIEDHGGRTMDKVTFYGQEKTATTIRLAKMNLAVHGLEGDIREANTFYEDVHELADGRSLWGNCDFIMANPPFNVDMVDSTKIKGDRRLPFGLPGVNKDKKVSNGNYLWISYFHSCLSKTGRSGFVMSSQASSAGHGEEEVRRKLVETGDVDVMVSVRSNFFYTRTVPCELWFFDKGKPSPSPPTPLPEGEGSKKSHFRGGYDFSGLVAQARELRKKQTPAEELLWQLLRNRQIADLKIRRQHQIGDYITDFYCHERKLVIELDGEIHETPAKKKSDIKPPHDPTSRFRPRWPSAIRSEVTIPAHGAFAPQGSSR
ncbi:MAG: N-6 DNA methylase [Akkermansiaceae bacterium]|nr:N-6 DNA methylase [Akkermansiaceae bacterium]